MPGIDHEFVCAGLRRLLDRGPVQYAAAGIPAYWRVETRPVVTLTAYELPGGADAYREVRTWGPGATARLERPFPVEVPIDAITPAGRGRSERRHSWAG